ncbi:MAG: nuclear transport factor 2 family protein [Gemmatimonadota bacterium]
MPSLRIAGSILLPAVLLCFPACGSSDAPPAPAADAAWEAVVAGERAFADAARESGVRGAFLRFIHEDGILFRPGPVPGVAALEAQAESERALRWTPELAGISDDGVLGYTTGPYQAAGADGKVTGTGRYLTLWRLDGGDEYRFVLDAGVPGPGPQPFPDTLPVRRARVMATRPVSGDRSLEAADSALRALYRSPGAGTLGGLAFPAGLRVLRPGREPERGPGAFLAAARRASEAGDVDWQVAGSATSPDGSLGYLYGMAVLASEEAGGGSPGDGPARGPFVRVWARGPEGAWQLLVDLLALPGT